MDNVALYNLINVEKGTTFPGVNMAIYVNDVPLDLSNASIHMIFNNGEVTWSTITGEITIDDPVNGLFSIVEQNVNLRRDRYHYYMEFRFPGNIVKRYITGIWRIT